VLATECCWGAIEDMERVKNIQSDLDTLVSQEIGFLAHALYESYVADLHRPEFNPFHIVSSASYMAFLNMDGSLRAGHDIFNRYC
jgi:hypothetical protein